MHGVDPGFVACVCALCLCLCLWRCLPYPCYHSLRMLHPPRPPTVWQEAHMVLQLGPGGCVRSLAALAHQALVLQPRRLAPQPMVQAVHAVWLCSHAVLHHVRHRHLFCTFSLPTSSPVALSRYGCPHNATWQMIDVETSIRAYSSFLYLGHILALGAIPLLLLCPVPAWAEPYKGSLAAVNSGANHTSVMPVDAYYTAKPGATSKAAAAVARTRAGAGAAAGAAGSRAAGAAGAGGAQGGSGGGGKPRKGGARQRRGHKARG